MPLPMDFDRLQEQSAAMQTPYPAKTKQAAGLVSGVPTDVMFMSFADKIMVTITQEGRLAQWVSQYKHDGVKLSDPSRYMYLWTLRTQTTASTIYRLAPTKEISYR